MRQHYVQVLHSVLLRSHFEALNSIVFAFVMANRSLFLGITLHGSKKHNVFNFPFCYRCLRPILLIGQLSDRIPVRGAGRNLHARTSAYTEPSCLKGVPCRYKPSEPQSLHYKTNSNTNSQDVTSFTTSYTVRLRHRWQDARNR